MPPPGGPRERLGRARRGVGIRWGWEHWLCNASATRSGRLAGRWVWQRLTSRWLWEAWFSTPEDLGLASKSGWITYPLDRAGAAAFGDLWPVVDWSLLGLFVLGLLTIFGHGVEVFLLPFCVLRGLYTYLKGRPSEPADWTPRHPTGA
eukprot:15061308-Alexandrium_andersonii.AAC.1